MEVDWYRSRPTTVSEEPRMNVQSRARTCLALTRFRGHHPHIMKTRAIWEWRGSEAGAALVGGAVCGAVAAVNRETRTDISRLVWVLDCRSDRDLRRRVTLCPHLAISGSQVV